MSDWRLWWYYCFQIAGGLTLLLMLVTVLSPWNRVRCNPVLTSYCATWVISAPMMCLLLFANRVTGPPPSHGLCLASAALVMSQTNLVATSGLALVAHVYTLLAPSVKHRFSSPWFLNVKLLAIGPYVIFSITVLTVLGLGLRHPDKVHRSVFYCVVDIDVLTIVVGVYNVICLVAVMFFEVLIIIGMRREHPASISQRVEPQLLWRVVLFGIYASAGLGLAIQSAIDWTSVICDMFLATFGFAMFITFGSQKAIVNQWKANVTYPCRRIKEVTTSRTATFSHTSGSSSNGKRGKHSSSLPDNARIPVRPPPRSQQDARISRLPSFPVAVPEDDVLDAYGSTELATKDGRKDIDPFTITTVDEVDSLDLPPERKYSSRVPRFMSARRPPHEVSTEGNTTLDQNDTTISFAPPGSTIHSTPSYMQ